MKTVKVRIAVAVDPSGSWNASGWLNADGRELDLLMDDMGVGGAFYWVTAELPIPSVQEVAGEVEDNI
jgi:hypothetical protein